MLNMRVDVLLAPSDLTPLMVVGRVVVVFDVLRATTSIAAALSAGVHEIELCPSVQAARIAAALCSGPRILAGEENCVMPDGFDLGNSPRAFDAQRHGGRRLILATTNGTRAMLSARGALRLLAGALVNRAAVADALHRDGRDTTLLCAGTNGLYAMEDHFGAGALLDALLDRRHLDLGNDAARTALLMWRAYAGRARELLAESQGGANIIAAGLESDIDHCAQLDIYPVVGEASGEPLVVRPIVDASSGK